jgi:hypothetical protein
MTVAASVRRSRTRETISPSLSWSFFRYSVRAKQVVEAVGLQHHRDQVGLVRLIDRDEALLQQGDRLRRRCFR